MHRGKPHKVGRLAFSWPLLILGNLAVGLSPLYAENRAATPLLIIEPDSLDFGVVHQLESFTRNSILRNAGTASLEIQKITTSCGCAVAELAAYRLAPNDSTLLIVTFNSKRFLGLQTKWVRIHTNEPDHPVRELPVLADVRIPIVVEPERQRLFLGKLMPGETSRQVVHFKTEVVPRLELRPTLYDPDLLIVSVEPDPGGGPQTSHLVVQANPNAPGGSHRQTVRVETNVPTMPHVDLEVAWEVLRDIELSHTHINFRYVEPGQRMARKLRLRSTKPDESFQVTGVEIDLPEFVVQIDELPAEGVVVISIEGQAPSLDDPRATAYEGRVQGTLRIFTDHPELAEFSVPVTYLLRK